MVAPQKKKLSLEAKVDRLADVVERGFSRVDKKFAQLEVRMERGFAAVADEFAEIRKIMATKEELYDVRDELRDGNRRVEMKVESVDKRLDYHLEAHKGIEIRVSKLEAKASR